MNTAYLEFKAGYNDLIKQLEYHSDAEEIIYSVSNLTDPKLSDVVSLASGYKDSKYRNVSARFNYNVAIISLYGLFEQFMESQIENFVKNISRLALCYDDLPENLKSNHSLLTLKYAQKNLSDKYIESETKNTNHKLLIQSLYESLNHKAESFSIDAKVFSSHTSNFRCELINVMFGYIGVERVIEKTLSIEGHQDFYKKYFGVDDSENNQSIVNKINEEISDLVIRRNRIAHGVVEDELISPSFMKEKSEFLKKVVYGVFEVCSRFSKEYERSLIFKTTKSFCLGVPANFFARVNSFGFSVRDLSIENLKEIVMVGQMVFLVKDNIVSEIFEVESLVHNNKSVSIFEATDSFDFGIKFSTEKKLIKYKNHSFYFSI
ncbi:MAE_28990/MAE_18760 family HEPN-like nuclease [Yersinia enterocolitica]|nr:hypothetical protein [Yersinia enterocolitica]ELX2303762.1 hypothetical protein [Yersinia enterocolitica]